MKLVAKNLLKNIAFFVLASVSVGIIAQPEEPKRKDYPSELAYKAALYRYSHEVYEYQLEKLRNKNEQRVLDASKWSQETYEIDLLKITLREKNEGGLCTSGGHYLIHLEGLIGPDSSFAVGKLLTRHRPCRSESGDLRFPITLSLDSSGGFLSDGYALGRTLRKYDVHTLIKDSDVCASSCAVAFLGGTTRTLESSGRIMYHAPYFTGENAYGKRDVNCEVGKDALDELNAYYGEMTDAETGDRLFERTMWYCSADDGWVVTGGPAAELYGIATEK